MTERGAPVDMTCPLCKTEFVDTSRPTTEYKAVGTGWFPPTERYDELRCPHCPGCGTMLLCTFVLEGDRLVPRRVGRHPLEEIWPKRLGYPDDMTFRGPGGREVTVGELNANKEARRRR